MAEVDAMTREIIQVAREAAKVMLKSMSEAMEEGRRLVASTTHKSTAENMQTRTGEPSRKQHTFDREAKDNVLHCKLCNGGDKNFYG